MEEVRKINIVCLSDIGQRLDNTRRILLDNGERGYHKPRIGLLLKTFYAVYFIL